MILIYCCAIVRHSPSRFVNVCFLYLLYASDLKLVYTLESLVITMCTTCFNIIKLCILLKCIYGLLYFSE
jgi:hypothetical protein